METRDLPRYRIIKSLTAPHPETGADVVVDLWEPMAAQIISIIGETGFNSLYERSLFLGRSSFPWLAAGALSPQANQRFAALKTSLEAQTPEQASAANGLLLLTFTDILASLIGEQLTIGILRSAWGDEVAGGAIKESKNG